MNRAGRFASVVMMVAALGACGDDAVADPDAGTGEDGGGEPTVDAGDDEVDDAGPIPSVDAGACEDWGLPDEGEPITGLAADTWQFVDFPDAHCMNGDSTGIGINLSPNGPEAPIAIYLQGGGACFEMLSCYTVANQDGFPAGKLNGAVGETEGIFDRSDVNNPVRDWTFVFVPYCTGDAHAGTNVEGFGGREQVGHTNVVEYLKRLVPTFRDTERVLLTGSSAGGLGAAANFDTVKQAFGCTRVDLLDDSGPIFSDEYLAPCLQKTAREAWGIYIPSDCPQCEAADGGGLSNLWAFYGNKYPDARIGFLSSQEDQTMRTFYSYGLSAECNFPGSYPGDMFAAGVSDIRDNLMGPFENMAVFTTEGSSHTYLGGALGETEVEGVTLADFINGLLSDDPAWTSVGP